MKKLDDVDRRLLALLKDDARLPMAALAKAVGLSRSATQERVWRLEKSGVITGYTARLAPEGAAGVSAWLAIRFSPGASCATVVPQLSELPQVQLAHSVAGPVDLWVLVSADAVAEIAALRERVRTLRGVASVETTQVLAVHIDRLSR
jgi:DNA-binding Lrp family transcriptional regulator